MRSLFASFQSHRWRETGSHWTTDKQRSIIGQVRIERHVKTALLAAFALLIRHNPHWSQDDLAAICAHGDRIGDVASTGRAPGYDGGEAFTVAAMCFAHDAKSSYFAILTSVPPDGAGDPYRASLDEREHASYPGDAALSLEAPKQEWLDSGGLGGLLHEYGHSLRHSEAAVSNGNQVAALDHPLDPNYEADENKELLAYSDELLTLYCGPTLGTLPKSEGGEEGQAGLSRDAMVRYETISGAIFVCAVGAVLAAMQFYRRKRYTT